MSAVQEFPVGTDAHSERVVVVSDGKFVTVRWGCVHYRFTAEDLADRVANVDLMREYGAWLWDRDSDDRRYLAHVDDNTFWGNQRDYPEPGHTVPWDKFREALDKGLAVKDPSLVAKAKRAAQKVTGTAPPPPATRESPMIPGESARDRKNRLAREKRAAKRSAAQQTFEPPDSE